MTEQLKELGKDSLKMLYIDILPMDFVDPKEVNTLWVLSTGRCGTLTLSQLLDLNPKITCFHEPMPRLWEHSNKAFYDPDDEFIASMVRTCRIDITSTIHGLGYWYGEAGHRMTPFAPYIKRVFPKAKFIWLMRDLDGFVQSAYQWHWYDLELDKYRDTRLFPDEKFSLVRDLEDARLTLAWYWCVTNAFIIDFLKTIDREDWAYIGFNRIKSKFIKERLNTELPPWGLPKINEESMNRVLFHELNKGKREPVEKTWGQFDGWAREIYDDGQKLI
jgi:hypothetical protein